MPQYTLPAPVATTSINLLANVTQSGVLPLQGDKNFLTIIVLTANKANIVFAASAGALVAADGLPLTAGDTFVVSYDVNSRYFMVYTSGAGSLITGKLCVNGSAP